MLQQRAFLFAAARSFFRYNDRLTHHFIPPLSSPTMLQKHFYVIILVFSLLRSAGAQERVDFNRDVRPILAAAWVRAHTRVRHIPMDQYSCLGWIAAVARGHTSEGVWLYCSRAASSDAASSSFDEGDT